MKPVCLHITTCRARRATTTKYMIDRTPELRFLELPQDLPDIPIDENRAPLQLARGGRLPQVDAGVDRPFISGGHALERILDDARRVPAHPELQEQEPRALVPPQEIPVPPRGEVPGRWLDRKSVGRERV